MRNLLLVILISASSVWASDSYSQNTQLKLSVTEGRLNRFSTKSVNKANWNFFTIPIY